MKHDLDLVRQHAEDRNLLAQVMRLLRDRADLTAALDEGIADLTAGRMLTAWPADDEVIVLAIARHDTTAEDVYATLLAALDLTVPEEERRKPPAATSTVRRQRSALAPTRLGSPRRG